MTQFNEETAQKSFDYLQSSEEEYAQLSAAHSVAEDRLKALEARLYLQAEGAQEKRKMEARGSKEYSEMLDEIEDITAQFRAIQAKRNRAQHLISATQTILSSRSKGMI